MKSILTLLLLAVTVGTAFAQTAIPVFPRQGTVWKYNQTDDVFTATGGTGWTAYDYDDSGPSWQEGPALLSSDSGNTTIAPLIGRAILGPQVPPGTAPAQHVRYFRKKFNYTGSVGPYTILRMNERIDDAAVFWLNGTEVGRIRLPETTAPGHLAWSFLLPCGGDADCDNTVEFVLLSGTPLVQGDNILAVSVHQGAATHPPNSSDITFGVSLDVVPPQCVTIVSNSEPASRIVVQNRPTTLNVYANGSPRPTYQWYYRAVLTDPPTAIADATNSSYTIASMQPANVGHYHSSVMNPICTNDSRTAFVDFTTDGEPPLVVNVIATGFGSVFVQFNEAIEGSQVLDNFNWSVYDPSTEPPTELPLLSPPAASLSSDGTLVTLTLDVGTLLAENTLYGVRVAGLFDLAGNAIVETNVTFRSFVSGCSTYLFETYGPLSTTDNNINNTLKVFPDFPDNPREPALRMAGFDTRYAYSDNAHEGFGARVRGLFVPARSGAWVFYLASDDYGEFYINPSGPDSAGKTMVAVQTGCCNDFAARPSPLTSVPLNLTAGQPYYVEALYKEGTGGDWLKVVARLSSEPVPPGPNANNLPVTTEVFHGSAGPAGVLAHVAIGTEPADQSLIAGQPVTFRVRLTPDVPGCFQWRRDDGSGPVDIPNEIGPNYRIPVTALSDNGAKFSVAVSLMGGTSLASREATLSVSNDVTPPTVVSVTRNLAGNFTVTFSEQVNLSVALYSINGAPPVSATLLGNNAVVLDPGPLPVCPTAHSVTIRDVTDIYNNPLDPDPTTVSLTLNDLLVLPINASHNWTYDENSIELGDEWYATAFNDTAWSNGPPMFGFETATVMPAGFPIRTANNWTPIRHTIYYRTHFNLSTDPSTVTNLVLHHSIDDGAVFYLNGQELTRVRMAPGPVTTNTQATATDGEPHDVETMSVPTSALVFGDNVLAARVHQNLGTTGTSSDVVFGAGLIAQSTGCAAERPRLAIEQTGPTSATIRLISGPNGTIYRSPTPTGPYTAVGVAPQNVVLDQPQQFYSIRP